MIKVEEFLSKKGIVFDISKRLEILDNIENVIRKNERLIKKGLEMDLNKTSLESYLTEIALVYSEINYFRKHLKKLIKPQKVKSGLKNFGSKFSVEKNPYGNVLIFGPWNYPFLLLVMPLIGAIAAGNRVVIKPSEFTKFTSKQIVEIFEPFSEYILIQEGNADVANYLLSLNFDFVFFTGSTRVGKIVAEKCAKNLIPAHLELGGKSPVIVDDSIDLEYVAKKIAYAKMINSGQTCVAPDYLLVRDIVEKEFIELLKQAFIDEINTQKYQSKAKCTMNPDRIEGFIADNINETIFSLPFGDNQHVSLVKANENSKLWLEEIFGTVLPYKTYSNIEEAIKVVNEIDSTPLAFYIYSDNDEIIDEVKNNTKSGSFIINDSLVQMVNNKAPFGGVGTSGYGKYFGPNSFDAFSYMRTIMKTSKKNGIALRGKITDKNLSKYKKLLEK